MAATDLIPPATFSASTLLRERRGHDRSGVALVLVLSFIVLLAGIVVAILTLATTERTSAGLTLQRTQAELLADATVDSVMGTITDAVTQGSQPNTSWASEPGRIWIFNFDSASGAITRKSVDLISALPKADPDNCDLNAPSVTGEYPIAPPAPATPPATGLNTAANMKVGWKYFVRDPAVSTTGTKANPAVARVAYWVDDESCKVNINTADGSLRTNATPKYTEIKAMNSNQVYSYGFGTPSEISLAALPGLNQTIAAAVAAYPWQQEYNSAEEITRAKDATGVTQQVTYEMFKALKFDITHFNSSPDLNFMGQPRINLIPRWASGTTESTTTARQNAMIGASEKGQAQQAQANNTNTWTQIFGGPLDFIYPQPSQLPLPNYLSATPTKFFLHTFSDGGQLLKDTNNEYYVGLIISQFFNNINLAGKPFVWPKFDGVTSTSGFLGKYTTRQLDSITLQILDVASKSPLVDQFRPYSMPGVMMSGWLSGQPVIGVGRAPKITEILVTGTLLVGGSSATPYGTTTAKAYTYPNLQFDMMTEFYLPAGYMGTPIHEPFDGGSQQWAMYPSCYPLPNDPSPATAVYTTAASLNFYDYPLIKILTGPVGTSRFGSVWMDKMITDVDQSNNPAGIDLLGNTIQWDDPDQTSAKAFHPYTIKAGADHEVYTGSTNLALTAGRTTGIVEFLGPIVSTYDRAPGCYYTIRNRYPTTPHPGNSNTNATTTSIRLKGGFLYSSHYESNGAGFVAPVLAPFDSMVPEWKNPNVASSTNPSATYDAAGIAKIVDAAIPVDLTIAYPGKTQLLLRVADPLVNQLPGDWQSITNPASTDVTMYSQTVGNVYLSGDWRDVMDSYYYSQPANLNTPPPPNPTAHPQNYAGDNPGFRPSGGGDPLSIWLPNQEIRMPKQARFPSVGALFSVRTGVFADPTLAAGPVPAQKGTPFRAINMSPSTQASQATAGGLSYPDWAMLDLFNVPFLPQKPYMTGDTATPIRRLTYGGATIGRMNINNPVVPYPFSVSTTGVTQAPPKRNALKALFQGLNPSNQYDSAGAPTYSPVDAPTSATLAQAITDYQATNGPFFMAGQIANVPAIAAYLYTGGTSGAFNPAAISRNDVVRDTIGAITTRSNVYSVWVAVQTFKKKSSNTNYDVFETSDVVTSEVRRHYLVERYLDAGKDGAPGNTVNPAVAGSPGTYTLAKPTGDPVDVNYHPSIAAYPLPYRWRVVAVENFQL